MLPPLVQGSYDTCPGTNDGCQKCYDPLILSRVSNKHFLHHCLKYGL